MCITLWSRPRPGEAIEAEYRYDAFGRRTAKIVRLQKWMQATGTHGGSGDMQTVGEDVTFFVWDGDVLVQEIRPDTTISYLYEPDSFVPLAQVHSDTPDSAYDPEAVKARQANEAEREQREEDEAEKMKWLKVTDANAHALAAATIEERNRQAREEDFARLEREAKDDRMYFIHADHLGTPQEVVSEEGKVVWLARDKAWGRIYKLDKEEIAQPFRFQGQYEDAETGLFYNRHRYYDPDTARYLTQDPIGLLGGENTYQYAPNPIGWVDPRGLARSGGKGGSAGPTKAKNGVSCPTNCNPCVGKNPAAEAESWQGKGDYPGVDAYENTILKKGTILYALHPHHPVNREGFYSNTSEIVRAKGGPLKYHERLQVILGINPVTKTPRAHRKNVHAFYVKEDICVARGRALTQPKSSHGSGGGLQYFVTESEGKKLTQGKVRPL